MGKIEEKKKQKREKLMNVAYELFTEIGVEETSISDIAHRAGVAKGTFYLYFKDKYQIQNLLIIRKSNQIFKAAYQDALKLRLKDSEDNLYYMINHIIDQLAGDPKVLEFIAKNLNFGLFKTALTSDTDETVYDFEKLFDFFIYNSLDEIDISELGPDADINDLVADFQPDTSTVKYKDPEIMVFMIMELVSSCCHDVILSNTPFTLEDIKPYLFDVIKGIVNRHRI